MNRKNVALIVVAVIFGVGLGVSGRHLVTTKPMQLALLEDFFSKIFKVPQLTPSQNKEEIAPVSTPRGFYTAYEDTIISAIEKASPAVVSIVISKDVPIIEQCTVNPFGDLPPEFQQFFGLPFQFSQPCQKGKKNQQIGGGSGFIVSHDGLIVTNKHVVADTEASYTVFTNDEKKYEATVVARDPVNDIAVLRIHASNLPTVSLGDSRRVRLGQTAIAIGNALGEFRNTVSLGIISGLARNLTAGTGQSVERIEGVFQTDAAINPGNSGGPLLNSRGEVIGVNTAIVAGAQNIGFAIPINVAKKDVASVQTKGKITASYLGVRYNMITPELAERDKLPLTTGALLRGNDEGPAVLRDSPAAKAGLRAEDIVTAVDGNALDVNHSLLSFITQYAVGDVVHLTVFRDGKSLIIPVTLEERK